MACRYFIAGTDTEVGKTYIAAKLLSTLAVETGKVGYIKPFQTGCRNIAGRLASPDVGEIKGLLGPKVECHVLHAFELPACPLLAARDVGVSIGFQSALEWTRHKAESYEIAVIEGVGGLMVPLTERETVLDFAMELGYPVILVAANKLGCINHSLLSIEAIMKRGLTIEALLLNDIEPSDDDHVREANAALIAMFAADVKMIRVRYGEGFTL